MGVDGFGHRLRWARDEARLSQEQLSRRAGVSQSWVTRIELGHEPGLPKAVALYEALAAELPGLSLEWLMLGRGEALYAGRVEAAVERREFVRRLVAGAALLPSALPMALDAERLGSSPHLDASLLDAWEALTGACAALRPMQPPRELLPMIEGHLFSLQSRVAHGSAPEALWRRLLSIAAGTGALAAWVCLMAARRRDARSHLELAEELAREAEDVDTLTLVLMLRADLLSAIPSGGQEGFPVLARRQLEEALALTSPATPVVLRAPLLLRSAEEAAYMGLEGESLGCLDAAEACVANGRRRDHYLRPRTFTRSGLAGFRGNCLQMLGRTDEAIEVLTAVDYRRFPADQPATLADLAAAHARQGDLDRTCELLTTATDLVAKHGLAVAGRRIVGVRRRHLARWDDEPAVQRLDERLATIL